MIMVMYLVFLSKGELMTFKEYVLDDSGDVSLNGKPAEKDASFKIKSRKVSREINVSVKSGGKAKKVVYEKQVVFWAQKYADKARAERSQLVKKAMDLLEDPEKYERATSYGAAKYIKDMAFDKDTGQIVKGRKPSFDFEKLSEDEKYDGYYAIVTSELDMSGGDIIDTYRGLWEIEETFKVTKGTLEARPVYVSRKDRIGAHFLTCFVALVIIRLIDKKTGRKYSAEKIVSCLNNISCSNEQDNLYLFDYRSKISDAIGAALGIDFTKKRLTQAEIKNILATSKK